MNRRWLVKGTILGSASLITAIWWRRRIQGQKLQIREELQRKEEHDKIAGEMYQWKPPSRRQLIDSMQQTPLFDVLIVGAGATGAGCALEATQRQGMTKDGEYRQLKVLCVDANDFASGTSGKSTKLVHGGVRYLEAAVRTMSLAQFSLVREALEERSRMLKMAPHLCHQLPIMLPVYTGQMDDARVNVAVAQTAIYHGATVLNYMRVVKYLFAEKRLTGAVLRDELTNKEYMVHAKIIVNATGPFTADTQQQVLKEYFQSRGETYSNDIKCSIRSSRGVHIVLPSYYAPAKMGLLDPRTPDGRVLFFLPWLGNTVAGTTDVPQGTIEQEPAAPETDVDYILQGLSKYLGMPVLKTDVLATWCGLRPLVYEDKMRGKTHLGKGDISEGNANINPIATKDIVRSHQVVVCPTTGMISIMGGKWTTFRRMASDTIDVVIESLSLYNDDTLYSPKRRNKLPLLVGAYRYDPLGYLKLIQYFGLPTDIAQHLHSSYGDRALHVLLFDDKANKKKRKKMELDNRLHPKYPFIENEVRYAIRQEYAQRASDVIGRRLRLAFLSVQAADACLDRVIQVMAEELDWNYQRIQQEKMLAKNYLRTLGLNQVNYTRGHFQMEQFNQLAEKFHYDPSVHVNLRDILTTLYTSNVDGDIVSDHHLDELTVDLPELLTILDDLLRRKQENLSSSPSSSKIS